MKKLAANEAIQDSESPFLNLVNFKQVEPIPSSVMHDALPMYSPFKSVYELKGMEKEDDLENETLVELMDDFYDDELDEVLEGLANEAKSFYEDYITKQDNGIQNHEVLVERSLSEHFAPLLNEMDRFMDHTIAIVNEHDIETMNEVEWEHLIDQYTIQMETTAPEIEYWGFSSLKKLAKKGVKSLKKKAKKAFKRVKRAAKKGIKFLADAALKHIMIVFKKIFPGLIKLAYKMGLFKKIPKKYRHITDKILKKIGVDIKKAYAEKEIEYEQQKFDFYLANLITASSQEELELVDKEFEGIFEDELMLDYNLLEMENSRKKFVDGLKDLSEEESTQPVIDEFISAIVLASKLLGGRKKAISFIGKHLGGFFSKWVGVRKKDSVKFAKHIIDKGLAKFGFEVAPESEIEDGYDTIATVIENTTLEMAKLPETSFENEALAENHMIHVFENMASAYLPDILSQEQYGKDPYLRESLSKKTVWKRKKNRKRKRKCKFKKLNKELDIVLTPYMVNEVKTFGGNAIKNVLEDQFGVAINTSTPATIHLYETMPEGNIHEIITNDEVFNRQTNLDPSIISKQIFPLTSIASGLLLGEPALGCKCRSKCLNKTITGKHRYYYLEIPGAFPQTYTSGTGIHYLRNTTNLKVKLNFIKNTIKMSLFLSENMAQNIASEIRQYRKENASILINKLLFSGIKTAFSKHTSQNISIVHPKVIPGKKSGEAFMFIPRIIQEKLRDKLVSWTNASLSNYILNNSEQFVKAVDDALDGVSIEIIMEAPDGFSLLKNLIGFNKVQLSETIFSEKKLELMINIKPGYEYV